MPGSIIGLARQCENLGLLVMPALRNTLAYIAKTDNKYFFQGFAPGLNGGKSSVNLVG